LVAPYLMAVTVTLLVSGSLLLPLRRTPDVVAAMVNALLLAVWPLASAMRLLDVDAAPFWRQMEWSMIAVLPFTWALYVLHYTGHYKRAAGHLYVWVALFPLLSMILLFTDGIHHSIWSPWVWQLPYPHSLHSFGPGLVWVIANSFVGTLISSVMLARMYARVRGVYRRQVLFLALATWFPWAGLAIDLVGWQIIPGFSFTPYALMFAVLAAAWNVARFRIGDIVPVAREVVIDGLQDAVIVLDTQDRVIDYNHAALQIFPALQKVGTGQPIHSIWPDLPFRVDEGVKPRDSCQWEREGSIYDVVTSPLLDDRHQVFCRVVVLRNISELMAAQAALQEAHDRLEARVQERTAALTRANQELEREIGQRRRAERVLRDNEAQLRASLRGKEVLLKEIHHRVKNNMQVISSLLSLAAAGVHDAESQQVFQESQNRIRSMGLIHEKLYQSHDLAHVDLRDYIESLTSYLFRSYSNQSANITLELEVAEVYLNIDAAVPCGLILNELVSNALKHAFPQQQTGRIRVRFRKDYERRCTLEVSDNGVGLPDGAFGAGDTLGLRLVDTLVSQLDGEVQVDSSLGARFVITFISQ